MSLQLSLGALPLPTLLSLDYVLCSIPEKLRQREKNTLRGDSLEVALFHQSK